MKRLVRKEEGLTLIECLVIVAVLFLCALVVIPAMRAADEKNNRIVCMNNLNQISKALEAYSGDYNNYYPGKPAYGAASVTYDKYGCKVAKNLGVFRVFRGGADAHEDVFTNQVPTAKFTDSENCGVEDEMCIAFGATVDPAKRRVDQDNGPCQVGPVGLGNLLRWGYMGDLKPFYCPSWDIPNARFKESCGYDMCNDGESVGAGQINTLAAAEQLGGLDAMHFSNGNYHRASVARAGNEADGWYVKSGALGVQSSYVYRNQAVRQPPDADDQAKLPVFYTQPFVTTATGCPSFKTPKLLVNRALVADTFLRSYKDVKADKPGYGFYHHKEGYNVLYGDFHVQWYGDPEGRIGGRVIEFVQGPKGDGNPVKPEGDFAPFDKASAHAGTAAGVFVDTALKGAGQASGRATIWHAFDTAAGVDLTTTPLPQ